MADQRQDDDRPAKRQKCCNDLSPDVVENGNDPDVVENGNDPDVVENGNDPDVVENGNDPDVVENGNDPDVVENENDPDVVENGNDPDVVENGNDPDVVENGNDPDVVENGNDPDVVENGNDPNVVETFNEDEPTSSCIAQDPKIAWTVVETLEGPERKIYEILKQRVQVYTYCEHPFSLKESMISEWWRKAAEELKNDQPDAKIRTTMTKSIFKSLHQVYYRPRSAFLKVATRDIRKWYGLENLKRKKLRKKIDFLLDKERYVCPQKYYQTPQSYFKSLALPSLLRARYKRKTKSGPGLEPYHTQGRAPLFLATVLHQALEALKEDKPSKTAEEIYNQHLATWENTSQEYKDSVNEELRAGLDKMQRRKDIVPRKELSDPDPHAVQKSSLGFYHEFLQASMSHT